MRRARVLPIVAVAVLVGAALTWLSVAQSQQDVMIDVTGTWKCTTSGTMHLVQHGKYVVGEYSWDQGVVQGVLNGRVLIGDWAEAPTYTGKKDHGGFQFSFNEDASEFQGIWGYDTAYSGGGASWKGTRTATVVDAATKAKILDKHLQWWNAKLK